MASTLEAWAQELLAEQSGLGAQRRKHIAGVARRVDAALGGVVDDVADAVRAAAWLHDIGYAESLAETGHHAIDGARHVLSLGGPPLVVGLIAYHSGADYEAVERGLVAELSAFARPNETLLDVITYADMTTDHEGRRVTVQDRIGGILERYPDADPVHAAVTASRTFLAEAVARVEAAPSR